MIRIASALNPRGVSRRTRESRARIDQMAEGVIDPSPSMLGFLELTREGESFCWQVK
jgi:hypothetical protein